MSAKFAKLSAQLAAHGAHDPEALAAWIGRKKYGKAGMAAKAKLGEAKHRALTSHHADRVIRDHGHAKRLTTGALSDVEKEFTSRASGLGKTGQVSKAHQAVRDELRRRGAR